MPPITLISKRDGTMQEFDLLKIRDAVMKAAYEAGSGHLDIMAIVDRVCHRLNQLPLGRGVAVADIQTAIENTLMDAGLHDVVRRYILYRSERDALRARRVAMPGESISDYVIAEKYARYRADLGRRETWPEIVERVFAMHERKLARLAGRVKAEIKEVGATVPDAGFRAPGAGLADSENYLWLMDQMDACRAAVLDKRILPSMRSLQYAGPAIERNNAKMYNCSYMVMDEWSRVRDAIWLLLSGCGVGVHLGRAHVSKLAPIRTMDRGRVVHHVIDDTIEGWAEAYDVLLRCAVAGTWFEPSYHKIRPEGAVLRTAGGRAPGHLGLKASLEAVRHILCRCAGRQARPIDVLDILGHMGEAVLSGGVRRSAMIGLFDYEDTELFHSKAPGNYGPGINEQRALLNISAVLDRDDPGLSSKLTHIVTTASSQYGEPGYFYGGGTDGCNPCGEIWFPGVEPTKYELAYEGEGPDGRVAEDWREVPGSGGTVIGFCNLVEVNVAACPDKEAFVSACRLASVLATIQATYDDIRTWGRVSSERLIGVSLTGIMDNPAVGLDPAALDAGRAVVVETNAAVAALLGIAPSGRCTTVKPSGTASLVLGCASGIHPHHSRRYFRRVRVKRGDPVAEHFISKNPHMYEPGTGGPGSGSLVWPVTAPDCAITLDDMTGSELLDAALIVQEHWIGAAGGGAGRNNISLTVHTNDPLSLVPKLVASRSATNGVSFVGLDLDKRYAAAPREAVDGEAAEERFIMLARMYQPVDWRTLQEEGDGTSARETVACAGGVCELT